MAENIEQPAINFRKNVSLAELIISALTLAGVMIAVYVNIVTRQVTMDERIKSLEGGYQNIQFELRELNKTQTEILIQLRDKEDRKN